MRLHLLFVDDDGGDKGGGGGKGASEEVSLEDAINAAAEEVEKIITVKDGDEEDDEPAEKEVKKEAKKEVKKDVKADKKDKKDDSSDKDEESDEDEDDEDEEEDEDEELTPEQAKQAKNLHRLLTNPETAEATLRALAAQAGIKIEGATSEKKADKAVKSISEMVKEKLGSDYKFLGDKLANIFEELLPNIIKEQTKDVRDKLAATEERALLAEVENAQTSVKAQYVRVPDKLLREVLRIQTEGEMAPGAKSTPEKFFKSCLITAAENLNYKLIKKEAKPDVTTEGKKKEKSPLDNLEESRGSHKEGVKSTQVKKLDDAISAAVETVTASMK